MRVADGPAVHCIGGALQSAYLACTRPDAGARSAPRKQRRPRSGAAAASPTAGIDRGRCAAEK